MSYLRSKKNSGTLFVLSAPAGTGKSTLVNMLVEEFNTVLASVSFTTRQARQGEIQGVHYNFVTPDEFKQRIARQEFVEYVQLYGEYYGTSAAWINSRLQQGNDVFLVIDTQGARHLQAQHLAFGKMVYIFLVPPSLKELQRRLIYRGTESPDKIRERLAIAEKEIECVHFYDYCIVNDQLKHSYEALRSIYIAEKHRVTKDSFWN